MSSNVSNAVTSLKWSAVERFANMGISMVSTILLARILGTEAYGTVALLNVFIAFGQTFIESGMSSALIQKIDRTESDLSTVFYLNLTIAIFCYGALFIASPFISAFYNLPILTSLARTLGLLFIFGAFSVIQYTLLTIDLDYKSLTKSSLVANILGVLVGFSLAFADFGPWALVAMLLTKSLVPPVILYFVRPWRPRSGFSFASLRSLFPFSSRLLASGILEAIYQNLYSLVIGKTLNTKSVAQFTQANINVLSVSIYLAGIVDRVIFSILSRLQNETGRMDRIFLLSIRLSALVSFPVLFTLSPASIYIFPQLLGADWNAAGPIAAVVAIGYALYPVQSISISYIKAKGRSKLFFRAEIAKKVLTTITLAVTLPLGITAMAIGIVVLSYASYLVNAFYTSRSGTVTIASNLKALAPIWLISTASAATGWLVVSPLPLHDIVKICLISIISFGIYTGGIFVFQRDLFDIARSAIAQLRSRQ